MKNINETKNKHIVLKLLAIFMISITVLVAGAFMNKKVVIADSGFDSSYDSGGSSDCGGSSDWGSSSYDYGSSSYSGSGGGGGGSIGATILVFTIIIVIYILLGSGKSGNSSTNVPIYMPPVNENEALNKIKQHIPDFDRTAFLNQGYQIYLDVQNAWMNFNLDSVKDKLTDEMFNMYESQLDTLEVKGEQNIMKDFTKVREAIGSVDVQNGNITISAYYVVEFYDYIVEKSSGKLLRGVSNRKIRITYEMKFRQTLDKSSLVTHCPNCGADLGAINGATTCKYCGSKIVSENAKWVLTDKKNIRQYRL